MDKYTIHFHTERDGVLSFHFHANDALHALEQYMEDAVLDSDTVVTRIEVSKA